jgi:hypothetical protein
MSKLKVNPNSAMGLYQSDKEIIAQQKVIQNLAQEVGSLKRDKNMRMQSQINHASVKMKMFERRNEE